jgi:hypothetical protein
MTSHQAGKLSGRQAIQTARGDAGKAELPGHVPVMPSEKKKKDLLDKGGRFIKNSGEPL